MLNLPIINRARTAIRTTDTRTDIRTHADPNPDPNPDLPPVSPADLGLSEKFSSWRPLQWDLTSRILDSTKRFIVACAPTGFGKSLCVFAAAALSGRTVILTATKGLQDQLQSDFDAADIRGLGNYSCPITEQLGIPGDTTVADAPCQCGYNCARKRIGPCEYYDRYRVAQKADTVTTNYQCWLHDGSKPDSERGDLQFGSVPGKASVDEIEVARERQKVRMLIADEVHDCENQLCLFLGVDLSRRECLAMRLDWPDAGLTVDDWRQWATEWLGKIRKRVEDREEKVKASGGRQWSVELTRLRDMKRKLERLSGMEADDGWILNENEVQGKSTTGVRFDPLSPARYAEQVLWRGVEKIVLVSATVRPKTAELLGIDRDQLEFVEYESSFDPARRPTIFVPTVRMDYRTEQDDSAMKWMLNRVDDLIEARSDWKGIIHAVSYTRSRFIVDNSRHHAIMLTHGKHDKMRIVERFRRAEPPCVLVSPSVDTGFDFAGSQARYQLLIKIPFVSKSDKVVAARSKLDKEYPNYIAAQTLVQATGRIMRSKDDFGESILTDSHAFWFVPKVRKFLPRWWLEAYSICDVGLPEPIWFDEERLYVCAWCGKEHEGGPEQCRE